MELAAIIRAKNRKCSNCDYFCTYKDGYENEIVKFLYIAGWYKAEARKVKNHDKKLEKELLDSIIGSKDEQRALRKYYKKQG